MTANDRQTDHLSSEQLRNALAEQQQHLAELEKFNQALTSERQTLNNQLADCTRLLQASTTGLIRLDKSGLIESVNPHAVKLFGADPSFLLKKPFSLFIAPEDQSAFYITRTRVFAGSQIAPFEIKLKTKDGEVWSARITAQPLQTPNQHLPGMLLAVEDISAYRQALDTLQLKEYFINLLFSIIDDLSSWSPADIDDIIITTLEKVGVVSGADRVYVCLFHDRKTHFSITHEWLNEGIKTPKAALQRAGVKAFSNVFRQVKKGTIRIADIRSLAPADAAAHEKFHAAGVQSLLFTPLFYGGYLVGIIGCDAVKKPVAWSQETQLLLKCVGSTIVNALIRRQMQQAPAAVRDALLQFVKPQIPTGGDDLLEYEGPIEVLEDDTRSAGGERAHWHFEAGEPDDPQLLITALLKDGKTANIACHNCSRQKLIDISEIRSLGTRLKATCTCGNAMYIKVELRREHRKQVSLKGVFIRGGGDQISLDSDDWGSIHVHDLSRSGIRFNASSNPDIRVDDRFRVKFTLDNTASSVIQKEVVVRSVVDNSVGCQFVGQDPCDVTLGFYMMT